MQAAGVLAGVLSMFGLTKEESVELDVAKFMAEPVSSRSKLEDYRSNMQARMELLVMKIQVKFHKKACRIFFSGLLSCCY